MSELDDARAECDPRGRLRDERAAVAAAHRGDGCRADRLGLVRAAAGAAHQPGVRRAGIAGRDEHLFLLVMHELHHVLLGHTRLFPRASRAHNIAFDARDQRDARGRASRPRPIDPSFSISTATRTDRCACWRRPPATPISDPALRAPPSPPLRGRAARPSEEVFNAIVATVTAARRRRAATLEPSCSAITRGRTTTRGAPTAPWMRQFIAGDPRDRREVAATGDADPRPQPGGRADARGRRARTSPAAACSRRCGGRCWARR